MSKGFGPKKSAKSPQEAMDLLAEPSYFAVMTALGKTKTASAWLDIRTDGEIIGAFIGVSFNHKQMTPEVKEAFEHLRTLLEQ